jgi:acyl CoA:acetate/3-ketoacid CoA transferase beta subunit
MFSLKRSAGDVITMENFHRVLQDPFCVMNNLALNDADEIITELAVLRSRRNFLIVSRVYCFCYC